MEVVQQALAAYGATLGTHGAIINRSGSVTGVAVSIKKSRIRFESTGSGRLLASGPVAASTVETFVESFWFWEKQ